MIHKNKYGVPYHEYELCVENNDTGDTTTFSVDVGYEEDWGDIQKCLPTDCDDWDSSIGFGNDADGHSKIVSVTDAESGRKWTGNCEVLEWYERCVCRYVKNYSN